MIDMKHYEIQKSLLMEMFPDQAISNYYRWDGYDINYKAVAK